MNKIKTTLLVVFAFLALFAVGSFAVRAMPIQTVPPEKCEIEVTADYCTYSFTDSTENVATEFIIGETYTFNATSDYGYTLESVLFNNEIVSLPYTFVASVNDFVTISTEPITIIPNVISSLSDYSFTNINNEVVTEFTFGETYTITVTPTYCAEFEKIVFNGVTITENPYTFTLDSTSVSLEIWSNYSELPYSVSAENCSYYFMDVVGNYSTELKLGTIYTLYANPVDGYSITSATLNGMEISLPYQFSCNSPGETYDFVIYTQEEPVNNTVSIFLSYDDIAGFAYITDTAGNQVSEYVQNTDYIVVASPYYGYSLENITFNSGEELSNGSFNTGNETDITICVNFSVLTVAVVDIVEATNCSYTFTASWGSSVSELIYNRGYTLTATANDGNPLSTVEYMGETHALPYTFVFNNLTEKFVLNIEESLVYTTSINYVAENCNNWTVQDLNSNTVWIQGFGFYNGTTGLIVGNTYRGMFIPNTNCVFSSLTINGVDSSSLIAGNTFDFVAQEENNISLVCVEEVQFVSVTLNYDSNMCSACITDTAGNQVSEYAQNTDYIIVVNPFNGYEVSSIIWQPGIELTNNSVFNTGSTDFIPIFITCTPVASISLSFGNGFTDNCSNWYIQDMQGELVWDNANGFNPNGYADGLVVGDTYNLIWDNATIFSNASFTTISSVNFSQNGNNELTFVAESNNDFDLGCSVSYICSNFEYVIAGCLGKFKSMPSITWEVYGTGVEVWYFDNGFADGYANGLIAGEEYYEYHGFDIEQPCTWTYMFNGVKDMPPFVATEGNNRCLVYFVSQELDAENIIIPEYLL